MTEKSNSKHSGLKLALKSIFHSIKCDSSRKYERFFSIAYLPPRGEYLDCVLAGCLEVARDEDKQFYNPSKFYELEKLREAILHLIAAYSAFEACRNDKPPYMTLHRFLNLIYHDRETRKVLASLTEKYHSRMKFLKEEGREGE